MVALKEYFLKERIANLNRRIKAAAERSGRNFQEIQLVAVSKMQSAERVKEAISCGIEIVGENYIQEAREKYNSTYNLPISWHFIGHLQSNKAKYAVRMFELIHSVDSLKLAGELNKQAAKIGKRQRILVQVNISREPTKSGIEHQNVLTLIQGMAEYKNVEVCGLMTMPPFFDAPDMARPYFASLRHLRDEIENEKIPDVSMKELSMGMTGDFEVAIEEGATLVRIGTAIFGERP